MAKSVNSNKTYKVQTKMEEGKGGREREGEAPGTKACEQLDGLDMLAHHCCMSRAISLQCQSSPLSLQSDGSDRVQLTERKGSRQRVHQQQCAKFIRIVWLRWIQSGIDQAMDFAVLAAKQFR
jgi:hypothetical protein